MFYATKPSSKTPTPFAEFRVFFFSDKALSLTEKARVEKLMRTITDKLILLYGNIRKGIKNGNVRFEDTFDTKILFAKRIITEIHGFEIEEIDYDEFVDTFKTSRGIKGAKFFEFYRYVRFYRTDGTIKAEYDEWDIRKREKEYELELITYYTGQISDAYQELMTHAYLISESRERFTNYINALEEKLKEIKG